MAELTVLRYNRAATLLHGMDPRIKLAGTAALSIASLNAGPLGMLLASTVIGGAGYPVRREILRFLNRLRLFLFILLLVLIARALSTQGDPVVEWPWLAVSRPGVHAGLMLCWRLLLMVVLGLLLIATTPADSIRAAVHWFLSFIPFLPGHVISDVIGLLIRFIPMILVNAQKISDAQISRYVTCRRNPLYRMRVFSMSLIRCAFVFADQLSLAMAARGYQSQRRMSVWPFQTADAFSIAGIVLVCIILVIL